MPPLNTNSIEIKQDNKNWKFVVLIIVGLLIVFGLIFLLLYKNEKSLTGHCSNYFAVCFQDYESKWKVLVDTRKDFNLMNLTEGTSLSFVYSDKLVFKDSDQGFTTVSLLGENKQAYKDSVNGLTRIVTGTKIGEKTLIVLLASEKDINVETLQEIVKKIIIRKNDIRK